MKVSFRKIRLSKANKERLAQINRIIGEYQEQGLVMSLRQLYYQLVSRDVIPNKASEYAKLSTLLKEGRMAGVVDWGAIEDRLRIPYTPSAWDSPEDIMDVVVNQYQQPRMNGQINYLEVWVEKDALSGVLRRVTSKYHVPILVNRGYSSASAMYDSYIRFRQALQHGQHVVILYIGDFDPSGVDMIRDVYERPLEMLCSIAGEFMQDVYDEWVKDEHKGSESDAFYDLADEFDYYDEYPNCFFKDDEDGEYHFDVFRALIHRRFKVQSIALTREQITRYNPPPNPAKKTDPRSKGFIREHGGSSWEVDALRPEVLNAILTNSIESRIDIDKYEQVLKNEITDKAKLVTLKNMLAHDDIQPDQDYLEENNID